MPIEISAVYEGGVLKPDRPLPLDEHQRVVVLVNASGEIARSSHGMISWQGDVDDLRKLALEPEFGTAESP